MVPFFIRWFVNIVALLVVVHLVAGVGIDGFQTTVVAALVLGLLNAFLRPILILITFPLNVFSLGFFTLLINGFVFYLAARFVKGFTVAGFWSAFWAAILFSITSFFLNALLAPKAGFKAGIYRGTSRRRQDDDVIDVEGKVEDA